MYPSPYRCDKCSRTFVYTPGPYASYSFSAACLSFSPFSILIESHINRRPILIVAQGAAALIRHPLMTRSTTGTGPSLKITTLLAELRVG